MKRLDLKMVILISSSLAVALNVAQFTHDALASRRAGLVALRPLAASAGTKALPASPAPTPAVTPAPDPAAQAAAKLAGAGLRPEYAGLYLAVQARTGTPWQLLAAVHKVETGQSGDTARRSYAGAVGPMQFMPATFRAYALDGDGNGTRDITDLDDAMYTAGRYLAAGGASRGNIRGALYNYNHSWSYVDKVQGIAGRLGL